MASFNKLEMAKVLSSDPRITIKKSFFSTKVLYQPTGAVLRVTVNEYGNDGAATVESLLRADDAHLEAELARVGVPATAAIGNLRLEAVYTDDHQFAAVQAFRYANLRYAPVSELRIYEGKAAETISKIF